MKTLAPERRALIKWTLFLLLATSVMTFLTVALLLTLLMASALPNTGGILFVSAFGVAMGLWCLNVRKKLLRGGEMADEAWSQATTIGFLCIPSLALPIAALSLMELLSQANRVTFLRTDEGPQLSVATGTSAADSKVWSKKRVAVAAIFAAIALIAFGGKTVLRLQRLGGLFKNRAEARFEIDPKLSPREIYQLGARCNSEGKMECSLAAFARLHELAPTDNLILANLAMAESKNGRHEEAIRHFDSYFQAGGQAVDAMLYMARSHDAQGDKAGALAWSQQALSKGPNLVDVAETTARLLMELGRGEEAARLIEDFSTKYPNARSYFDGLREQLALAPATEATI